MYTDNIHLSNIEDHTMDDNDDSEMPLTFEVMDWIDDVVEDSSMTDDDLNTVRMSMFTVVFTMEAIEIIKRLSEHLEPHAPFRDYIEKLSPILLPELDRFFEQKLAMYISLNIKNRQEYNYNVFGDITHHTNNILTITDNDVIHEVNVLVHVVLNLCYRTLPPEGTLSHMLDGYPLSLLSKVCGSNILNSHIIGESMRRFVQIRKTHKHWLPLNLQMATFENCPLVGESNSPLDMAELEALYRYLDTKNSLYVTMLLNCIFELREHDKILKSHIMDPESIIKLCGSSWLCLFLSTVTCDIA